MPISSKWTTEKVGGSNKLASQKAKFTLNLQQLKAVHHVSERKDILSKSQIRNVIYVQCFHEPALKTYTQPSVLLPNRSGRYIKVSHLL